MIMKFINSFILLYFLLSTIQITLSDVIVNNNSNKKLETFDDQVGAFLPAFPSDGLQGYVTTTNPSHGCTRISPPPNIATSGYKWIALIPRTRNGETCEFVLKIQNAYNANYSAVIIYNYEDAVLTMGPDGADVNIPATLISLSDGLKMISKYVYNVTAVPSIPLYHVQILPDQPFKYGEYLIPFAVIVGVAFLGLAGFTLVRCYLLRRHTRRHRLPRSALKQLRTKKFVKGDPWEVCAICLDDYEDGAKLRILSCDHAYHMKCIDPWLINNRRQCPVCKRYVFPNHDNSDEEEHTDHHQTRPSTEQTPLLQSNDNNSSVETSRSRQLPERQLLNPSGSGVPNVSFASDESSSDEGLTSSLRPTTTAELVFNRPSSNSRRYGSVNASSTTPHTADAFSDSLGGITDNTDVSVRSFVQDVNDHETTDDDERIHSVIIN